MNLSTPVTCLPSNLPAKPVLPYTKEQLHDMNDGPERYKAMGADLVILFQRSDELEPLVIACGDVPH